LIEIDEKNREPFVFEKLIEFKLMELVSGKSNNNGINIVSIIGVFKDQSFDFLINSMLFIHSAKKLFAK